MKTIDLSLRIEAPIEQCWEVLSNQEGYTFAKQINSAKLVKRGMPEKGGVGAVLKLWALGCPVTWEVVSFEPPRRFEYRINKFPFPFRHIIGTVDLASDGGGTDVHWVSPFEVPVPGLRRVAEPAIKAVFGFVHMSVLKQAKKLVE